MDERKEFRAWCKSLTESDWLIAQTFEESFYLGAWAAWRHLRDALAAATERAEAAERRLRALVPVECCQGGDPQCYGPRGCLLRAMDAEVTPADELLGRALRAEARADALAARLAEIADKEHPA